MPMTLKEETTYDHLAMRNQLFFCVSSLAPLEAKNAMAATIDPTKAKVIRK